MSSGPLFRTLLTRSLTILGVRSGSGMASSRCSIASLSVFAGSNQLAYRSGGMMTGARSWTWPKESWAVVVRTVQLRSQRPGSSSGSDGSGQNS